MHTLHTNTHTHTHTRTYTHTHTHTYIYIYICMHIRTHAHAHTEREGGERERYCNYWLITQLMPYSRYSDMTTDLEETCNPLLHIHFCSISSLQETGYRQYTDSDRYRLLSCGQVGRVPAFCLVM